MAVRANLVAFPIYAKCSTHGTLRQHQNVEEVAYYLCHFLSSVLYLLRRRSASSETKLSLFAMAQSITVKPPYRPSAVSAMQCYVNLDRASPSLISILYSSGFLRLFGKYCLVSHPTRTPLAMRVTCCGPTYGRQPDRDSHSRYEVGKNFNSSYMRYMADLVPILLCFEPTLYRPFDAIPWYRDLLFDLLAERPRVEV